MQGNSSIILPKQISRRFLSLRGTTVTKQSLCANEIASLRCSETKYSALPPDSSLRWNDADDMPVIPGEHRETRNPGASSFASMLSVLRYG